MIFVSLLEAISLKREGGNRYVTQRSKNPPMLCEWDFKAKCAYGGGSVFKVFVCWFDFYESGGNDWELSGYLENSMNMFAYMLITTYFYFYNDWLFIDFRFRRPFLFSLSRYVSDCCRDKYLTAQKVLIKLFWIRLGGLFSDRFRLKMIAREGENQCLHILKRLTDRHHRPIVWSIFERSSYDTFTDFGLVSTYLNRMSNEKPSGAVVKWLFAIPMHIDTRTSNLFCDTFFGRLGKNLQNIGAILVLAKYPGGNA